MGFPKRRVCVVVASRANYGRVKSVLRAIQLHPKLELQLIVGASALLDRFGRVVNIIEDDGFRVSKKIHYVVEGETLLTQAKSTGLGIIELSTAFDELSPDVVVTVADRFETLSTALAATYMNIPLVHIQGGEVSGNIDDKVRHAITKLADLHFPATELSAIRLQRMAEMGRSIFNFGCPAMDLVDDIDTGISNKIMEKYTGVGNKVNWEEKYVLLIQHPVTTSYGDGYGQMEEILKAVRRVSKDYQVIVLWPNADAGSDDVSKALRVDREKNGSNNFHYYKNFSPEDYIRVLKNCSCAIGNSSSFLREGEYMGVPVVLIGDRQLGRECMGNVEIADYDANDIEEKVHLQISRANELQSTKSIYGEGTAGVQIADKIAEYEFDKIKRLDL